MATLDDVAETILRERYLRQDEHGEVVETPDELFHRVAENLATAEAIHGGDPDVWEERFYRAMRELEFLPNSPTLMNAGTELQQLAACFVLPIEDDLESIFTSLKETALIHQSGGGTGFSFSNVRPQGDVVQKTGGVASGPVSFMQVFDAATEQIKQGGRRRGANMGVLDSSHPDVEQFAAVKAEGDALRNFNLSVATDAAFWEAYESGGAYELVNPRNGEVVETVDPETLLGEVARMAWGTGDPGILFLDHVNEDNPLREARGDIAATNPCGEVPLYPYEACVLGSINLGEMTTDGEVDWERLEEIAKLATRFLDDAITMSTFPTDDIADAVDRTRKIGVGVMGLHDMLIDLGIPYDSPEAVEFADELMDVISDVTWETSRELAGERGVFPDWGDSAFEQRVRNATTTTIAPTGTISMIAGASASIEPLYDVAYVKQVMGGLEIVNDRFVDIARERGFYSEDLIDELFDRSSLRDVDAVPEDVAELFPTAREIEPEHHVRMQAAFQTHVDNAVSKTVNMPESADVEDVRDVFLTARDLGVKGVTVFRSGAEREEVLEAEPRKEECSTECHYVDLDKDGSEPAVDGSESDVG